MDLICKMQNLQHKGKDLFTRDEKKIFDFCKQNNKDVIEKELYNQIEKENQSDVKILWMCLGILENDFKIKAMCYSLIKYK